MASSVVLINARYQIGGKPIGQGGMGLVYKAYDIVTKRHVALKTMRGPLNPAALELFSKEWTVLARISHPNIVDILDTGELNDGGERKPFFVMPFLQGTTLDELIQKSSQRLTPARVVEIASQTCRGLQAAHEQGLVHRDLKPSNIFVMEDDTVKIIDFGVVHLVGVDSVTGLKGTVQYMAPEQIEMKPTSPASDVFALSVVCYEALTGRKPFARKTDAETAEAIRRHIPPPACELNPLVTQIVSRVIHKGMAKEPWHRFSSAREYGDTLQKAFNNQPIERFDRSKIQPRIDRAKKAQVEGDLQFASEILTELEAEGNIEPAMRALRSQIDHLIREKSVRQLLDIAKTRLEEDEFPLALQKIQEVLEIDPDNSEALGLRTTIEKQRSERQIENWFRLAEQHIHNRAFPQARQALEEILKISPGHTRAREVMLDMDRREEQVRRLWAEKEQLYQSALTAYQHGEVSSALTKLERVLELNRQSPDSALPERDAQYQSLYNQIRTERETARNLYAEGRRHMADRNFDKALEICGEFLKKFPRDPLFQALELEIQEQQRQEQSAYIAEVSRRAEMEPDLDRRVNILKEAAERYPGEAHFQQSLRLIRERRDLVNSIVAKARQYEERGQLSEALGQWDILRNIYAQYPGLEFEVERLKCRRNEQLRDEAKARWVEQIDRHIAVAEYERACEAAVAALAEFPGDKELSGLEHLAQEALERSAEAQSWLKRGQQLCFDRQFGEGLEALRKASSLDNRNPVIRAALLNALVEQARSVLGQDWRAAEPLIQQALSLDGTHPQAKSLQGLVLDYKRQEIVNECVSQARELQVAGNLSGALEKVDDVLSGLPNEVRLVQLRSTLQRLLSESSRPAEAAVVAGAQAGPAVPVRDREIGDSVMTIGKVEETLPLPPTITTTRPTPPRRSVTRKWRGSFRKIAVDMVSARRGRFSPAHWFMFALFPTILVAAFVVTGSRKRVLPPAPAAREYRISASADVPGTRFTIDGNAAAFPAVVTPGQQHTIQASLPGYKSASKVFSVVAGGAQLQTFQFNLEPEPVQIRLSSELKGAQVVLDQQPPQDIAEDSFAGSASPGSEHTFALRVGGRDVLSFAFRADPGSNVALTSPLKAQDVDALIVTSLDDRANIYASNPVLKAGISGTAAQPVPPLGLSLSSVPPKGDLVLEDGKTPRSVPIEAGNAPLLNVILFSAIDPDLARLQIQCNVADATVTIGARSYLLRDGLRQVRLRAGKYQIHVERDGYKAADQVVELAKAAVVKTRIDLNPIPKTGSVVIDGGTANAEVLLDGVSAGHTDAQGHFEMDGIAEGNHSILLKKAEHEDKQLTGKSVQAGQALRITGAEGQLAPWGAITFDVPRDVEVTWRSEDGQTRTNGPGTVRVKPGHYIASVRGFEQSLVVQSGKTERFSWAPPAPSKKETVPVKASPPPDVFQNPEVWTADGPWHVHNSGETAWVRNSQGTFTVIVKRPKSGKFHIGGSRLIFEVDYKDEKDRIEYTLDSGGTLERRVFVDGNVQSKHSTKFGQRDSYTLRIEIRPERIAVSAGGSSDVFDRPQAAARLGRFGFRGEASVQIAQEN
jgi:eukaryotic-like serine/threonine-protein kinase